MIGIFKYFEIKLVHVTAIVLLVPEMYRFEVPYQEKNRYESLTGYLPKFEFGNNDSLKIW